MPTTLLSLILAALLESGGDAAIRHGLTTRAHVWLAIGAVVLVLYGFVVNLNRAIDFSALMGVYIATFFVVSQVFAVLLGERPPPLTLLGGAFIVLGGLIVQYGAATKLR